MTVKNPNKTDEEFEDSSEAWERLAEGEDVWRKIVETDGPLRPEAEALLDELEKRGLIEAGGAINDDRDGPAGYLAD